MNKRYKRYKKDFGYSYAMGVFPTIEMLTHRPSDSLGVVLHPKGSKNAGVDIIQSLCHQHNIPWEIQEKIFDRIGARGNDYAVGIFRKVEPGRKPRRSGEPKWNGQPGHNHPDPVSVRFQGPSDHRTRG